MRILAVAAAVVTLATTLATAPSALACGEDTGDEVAPVVLPVSLLQRADRMDLEAAAFERSASAERREARMLDARAVRMRAEAAGAPWRMRASLLTQATDLASRAEQVRADAMAQEQRAASLRAEARVLRSRARGRRGIGCGGAVVNL